MKSYKTKEELLNHLKVDRHLNLEESLIPIFDVYRYGQVIDPYKDLLASSIGRNGVHIYDKDITLASFVNVMNIDEYLSIKLITYISHYEKILKKYISDKVCESMVSRGSLDCCDYTYFNEMKNHKTISILDCFLPIDKQYDRNGNLVIVDSNVLNSRVRVINKIYDFSNGYQINELNYYACDYFNTKQVIPFYILAGSLSFGNLVILFAMFKKELQIEFIKNIHGKVFIDSKDIFSTNLKHYVMKRIRILFIIMNQ